MEEELKILLKKTYQNRFPQKEFIPGESSVPVSGKLFNENEILRMVEAVLDGWWTEGRMTEEFEEKLAQYLGVKFCALVNSGSSANLLAFTSLTSHFLGQRRIQPGAEVITVAAGFPTTINPIIQNNCVPVFVDVDLKTFSIKTDLLEKALNEKTRAVMVAHTLGNPYEINKVRKFCDKNKLWFIEDNCDALGSKYTGKLTGTFGDISTVSFYPAHHITTGEGGAVFTSNALLDKIIRSIRDWGRDCWCAPGKENTCGIRFKWKLGDLPEGYDHKYIYSHVGYNLKTTDLQAACGLAQLEKLDSFIEVRKRNYYLLREKLDKFSDYFIFAEPTKKSDPSWFGFLITLKDDCGFDRDALINYLNERKIATRLLFAGNITKQPYFINYNIKYRIVGSLKNADKIMNDTFWIGLNPLVTEEMINWVESSFKNFIDKIIHD